jgi:hypothetical protein
MRRATGGVATTNINKAKRESKYEWRNNFGWSHPHKAKPGGFVQENEED